MLSINVIHYLLDAGRGMGTINWCFYFIMLSYVKFYFELCHVTDNNFIEAWQQNAKIYSKMVICGIFMFLKKLLVTAVVFICINN